MKSVFETLGRFFGSAPSERGSTLPSLEDVPSVHSLIRLLHDNGYAICTKTGPDSEWVPVDTVEIATPMLEELVQDRSRHSRDDLKNDFVRICEMNQHGSAATHRARVDALRGIADELKAHCGDKISVHDLTRNEIDWLIAHWKARDVSVATMKNRLSYMRWCLNKFGMDGLVPERNIDVGVGSKALTRVVRLPLMLSPEAVDLFKDGRIRCCVKLQMAFGLRRREAILFVPAKGAMPGSDAVRITPQADSGKLARDIPITNNYQREVLAEALRVAGRGALLPKGMPYDFFIKRYENALHRSGLYGVDRLRQRYAISRYEALAGRLYDIRTIDSDAAACVSDELGGFTFDFAAVAVAEHQLEAAA